MQAVWHSNFMHCSVEIALVLWCFNYIKQITYANIRFSQSISGVVFKQFLSLEVLVILNISRLWYEIHRHLISSWKWKSAVRVRLTDLTNNFRRWHSKRAFISHISNAYYYYINTLSHILWTYLLRNCRTDCRHFWHAGALWSNIQHRLCEIAPDGQVWEFLAIF